jgi:hypothetical protein
MEIGDWIEFDCEFNTQKHHQGQERGFDTGEVRSDETGEWRDYLRMWMS